MTICCRLCCAATSTCNTVLFSPAVLQDGGLFFAHGTIGNGLRVALAMFRGKIILNFGVQESLRTFLNPIFTGGVGNELPQSKPDGFASSLWEGAFGMAVQFPAKPQSLRVCLLPLGGAVAQRLRGYKWRSEKSVKAIAPTGAALAFLCFDFFFRIVKGEQPLARCGVGGVQR